MSIISDIYHKTSIYKLRRLYSLICENTIVLRGVQEASEHYHQVDASLYNAIYQRISSIDKSINAYDSSYSDQIKLEKRFIENKWRLIDKYYKEPDTMHCSICGGNIDTITNEKLVSEDIYGGGKIIRYKCPGCGAIVGPNKMLDMSEEELSEEYFFHYKVFDEGQTTDAEIKTFMALNPEKGKKYLDYGCGGWTPVIDKLRDEGYDVIGFDAYAPTDSPYIINDFKELEGMTFDGLFSHDLLEHLRYPVDTFKLFHRILAPNGIMAHSTACYRYVYEYERFHLVFYTGESVNTLCDRSGFYVIENQDNDDILQYLVLYGKKS